MNSICIRAQHLLCECQISHAATKKMFLICQLFSQEIHWLNQGLIYFYHRTHFRKTKSPLNNSAMKTCYVSFHIKKYLISKLNKCVVLWQIEKKWNSLINNHRSCVWFCVYQFHPLDADYLDYLLFSVYIEKKRPPELINAHRWYILFQLLRPPSRL